MNSFILRIAALSLCFTFYSCTNKQEYGIEKYAPYMVKEVLLDDFCNSAEYPSDVYDLTISGDSIFFSGNVDVYKQGLFTYLAKMKYLGEARREEYSDISNWQVLSLVVKNGSDTIWTYDGTNKPLLRTHNLWKLDKSLTLCGINFKVSSYRENTNYDIQSMDAIRLVSPTELSNEDLKKVIKYSRFRFEPIYFETPGKDEYASFDGSYFFRFKPGEFTAPIKAKDFLK